MLNRIVLFFIGIYIRKISPGQAKRCRFYPTCSRYCYICFENMPFFDALFASLGRLARCNRLCAGGIDFPKIRNVTNTFVILEPPSGRRGDCPDAKKSGQNRKK